MISFIVITTGFLASCGKKLTAPNNQICRDKGSLGARCNYTNEQRPTDLSEEAWRDKRFGMFCMNETAFAANQLFIEQACELVKGCDIEKLRAEYMKKLKLFSE